MTPTIRRFTIVLALAAAVLVLFQLRKPHVAARHVVPTRTDDETITQDAPRERSPARMRLAPAPSAAAAPSEDEEASSAPSYQTAIVERRARRLEASWKSGAPDLEWTRSARDAVTAQMQASGVRGKLTSVDCRTTLCRVDVQFARLEETMDLYKVAPADGHETFPVVSREGGNVLVAVYVAPKDVELKTITENQIR